MNYDAIKKVVKTNVNTELATNLGVSSAVGPTLDALSESMQGSTQTVFKSLVSTGGISTVAKHLGSSGLDELSQVTEEKHALVMSVLNESPILMSSLAGMNKLAEVFLNSTTANIIAKCDLIKTYKTKLSAFSEINSQLRAAIKINNSILSADKYLISPLTILSNAQFLKLNQMLSVDKAAIDGLNADYYNSFNMFADTSSTMLETMATMPLKILYDNYDVTSMLLNLDESDISNIASYINSYEQPIFNRLLTLLQALTSTDHLTIATRANITKLSGLLNLTVNLNEFTPTQKDLVVMFSQITDAIKSDILSLNQSVYVDLSTNYNTTEIKQIGLLSPNTWKWYDNFQIDPTQSLYAGEMAFSKAILSSLSELDYSDTLTHYNTIRTSTDTTNKLGVLGAAVVAEICNQKLYKDLSIYSTFNNMEICSAFLNYGDDRLTITDAILKNATDLGNLLGVSSSIFNGVNWLVLKSICMLSTTNLTKINTTSDITNVKSLALYKLPLLRDLVANSQAEYIFKLSNINLHNIYTALFKPTDSATIPSMVLGVSPILDLLKFSDAMFNKWSSILTAITHVSKLDMSNQITTTKYASIQSFFSLLTSPILAGLAGLGSTSYLNFKNTTKAQLEAITSLLDLANPAIAGDTAVPSFKALLQNVTDINSNMTTLSTSNNGLLQSLYKMRDSYSRLSVISYSDLLIIFSAFYDSSTSTFKDGTIEVGDVYLKYVDSVKTTALAPVLNYLGLPNIIKILSWLDEFAKSKIFPSQYIQFIAKLTSTQLQYIDASAVNAIAQNDLLDLFQSDLYLLLNSMTDSEIDSIGDLNDLVINIIKNDTGVLAKIRTFDYTPLSKTNGGPFEDRQIQNFTKIMT